MNDTTRNTVFTLLTLSLLNPASAQTAPTPPSASAILRLTQVNLDKAPWQATVVGKVKAGTTTQEAEVDLQFVPGAGQVMRLNFKKPAALEGNFTVLTDKEAWTYLFVSNQLVQEPKVGARLNTLAQTISGLGDLESLSKDVSFRLMGEVSTPDGPAWRLSGTPRKAGQAFASAEMLVLKSDPRPLNISLKDGGGNVMGTLDIRNFKRASLNAKDLLAYPNDASVVKK